MSITALSVNVLALGALVWALVVDRRKTAQALRIALRSFVGLLPTVLLIVVLIGLLLAFVTPDLISRVIGAEAGILGILSATLLGALMHIPALISFPLASSLIAGGASVGAAAALITSLTLVGTVSLPMELKELGWRMTLSRNVLGLLSALLIALAMEAIL